MNGYIACWTVSWLHLTSFWNGCLMCSYLFCLLFTHCWWCWPDGCYRCGFSTTQAAYDEASRDVREGLRRCEEKLSTQDFLCGSQFTEADLRLLPTMLRFDAAYAPLFKAGGTHLRIRSDYPHLHAWLKRCWAMPGIKDSIDLADATGSYFKQLFPLNPGGILPTPPTAQDLGLE